MTGVKAVALLIFVLAAVYALMYFGWLPRLRNRVLTAGILGSTTTPASATRTGTKTGTQATGTESTAVSATGSATEPITQTTESDPAAGRPRAMTLAWVEGTYQGTTKAISRNKRVAAPGLGGSARATMVVDDSTVRWEREGTGEVRVAGSRLLGVSMEREAADKLVGQAHLVLVSWTPDGERDDERYVTGFLPRSRADSAVLVSAVQRLMRFGSSEHDATTAPDLTP